MRGRIERIAGVTTEPKKLFIKSYGCQMNVYDAQRMADVLRPEGYVETQTAEDADLIVLNTCHIREKAAEKVYSELGRVRTLREARAEQGARPSRRRRLRRAGRGRRDPETRARSRCRGRAAGLSPPSRPRAEGPQDAGGRHGFPGRRQVQPSAGAGPARARRTRRHRFPHRAGGLRQVLRLLRRALYARGGSVPPGCRRARGGAPPRGSRHPRDHADRPERQRLSWRGTGRPGLVAGPAAACGRRDPGHRAAALHDQPPQRHGRRADRRPSRPPGPHALSASAGAGGVGCDPRRHEPAPHRRRLSPPDRPGARHPARHRPVVRFHRRFPRRDRCRFRGDDAARGNDRLRLGLFLQIQRAPRHAGGPGRGSGSRGREDRAARPPSGAARRAAPCLQRRHRGARRRSPVREAGPSCRANGRQVALFRAVQIDADGLDLAPGDLCPVEIVAEGSNSLFGRVRRAAA